MDATFKGRDMSFTILKEKGDVEPQKEQDFGRLNFIAKIEAKDDNFFKDVIKDGDLDANFKVMCLCFCLLSNT